MRFNPLHGRRASGQPHKAHQLWATAGLLLLAISTSTSISTIALAQPAPKPSKPQPVNRCGWFHNPTPANAWLTDPDGQWIISVQGGHQADGDWPDFSGGGQWVRTNGSYGYGCACIKLIAEPGSTDVSEVVSARVRPLKACKQDPKLPKPVE